MPVRPVEVPAAPEALLAAKGSTTVSVVLPARDEEETVGDIVRVVRNAWVEGLPLVDELVVLDSDSTDRTAEVARAAGARVHAAAQVHPRLGPATGKGEALWKSLHVTSGDLLVFLDADLLQWGPHFVPGLLGPLLTDPGVVLVKAVYDRPLLGADGDEAEAGGRVTELVARPLLALHHPELSGLVQPLAGEWAVRRTAFETFSVPVGYGVEIAAVLDTAAHHGAEAIAQVDLGRRAHRHHRHDTLGPMALQVLAAVEARRDGGAGVFEPSATLTQYDRGPEGHTPRRRAVDLSERPPAASVEGYGRAREESG
ncbi:glucosyl-3-phosphoglycerate synthase [Phycicoccus endophyticus]|uniref:Glucosyl-3-phosphoglycerate synthase n=1 Tax=Phycicoccus endophyticus TaxID=1690220 RepID=A0A7G9R1M8_9MICO|nr:glucosyl-3-phosphoglycerate synthase [Phycicoccus endophyticus]NHI18708.1 glucosyl-3-phosphoglycerate synthase [Phycicoccus endophyticus]QNN49503.1 glucosyl-3-phosphoglycerate synthase [Phycicoccus endophyticus]GGL37055.1 glucosyl-3-phosphoglycerate synthase [Phycicoccus endophyticus]